MSKDNPYYKFNVNQWLTGKITDQTDALQGVFARFCAYYWSQECKVSFMQATEKKFRKTSIKKLCNAGVIKEEGVWLRVIFLDEQWEDRQNTSKKNALNGAEGGKTTSYNRQKVATATSQSSQGEKIREDNKEIIGEGEKDLHTIFFRIQTKLYRMAPSDYFKQNFYSYYENAVRTQGMQSCDAALKKLDNDYYGSSFNEEMHVRNSFKTCLEKILRSPNSAGGKPGKGDQIINAHEESKKMLGL
jgi:hypothetical protein